MKIEDISFPGNLRIYCRKCSELLTVAVEVLRDNTEIECPACNYIFTPDVDFDLLTKLIEEGQNLMLGSDLVM